MNNNTRNRLLRLRPGQTRSFTIPHKIQGNHGAEYGTRTMTVTRLAQDRLSTRPKVGGART